MKLLILFWIHYSLPPRVNCNCDAAVIFGNLFCTFYETDTAIFEDGVLGLLINNNWRNANKLSKKSCLNLQIQRLSDRKNHNLYSIKFLNIHFNLVIEQNNHLKILIPTCFTLAPPTIFLYIGSSVVCRIFIWNLSCHLKSIMRKIALLLTILEILSVKLSFCEGYVILLSKSPLI